MQWATSPPVSLARVMLPYALRDPYRLSHFKSRALSRALSRREGLSGQPQQLGQCRPARHDHAGLAGLRPLDRPHVHVGVGRRRIPKAALETAAAEWDATTDVSASTRRRRSMSEFKKLPGLLRRPHGREAGHGGEARLAGVRALPANRASRHRCVDAGDASIGRALPGRRCARNAVEGAWRTDGSDACTGLTPHESVAAAVAALSAHRRSPHGRPPFQMAAGRAGRACSSWRCRSIRCCFRSGSPSSTTTSRSPATPSSA